MRGRGRIRGPSERASSSPFAVASRTLRTRIDNASAVANCDKASTVHAFFRGLPIRRPPIPGSENCVGDFRRRAAAFPSRYSRLTHVEQCTTVRVSEWNQSFWQGSTRLSRAKSTTCRRAVCQCSSAKNEPPDGRPAARRRQAKGNRPDQFSELGGRLPLARFITIYVRREAQ